MTIRTANLATLLMVGAALLATPVLAQALTAGNTGPAEIPPSRDAPLQLPGTLTPMPTPKVDASVSRDLFGSVQSIENLGTISLDRSGDVTETEASEALRAAFAAETRGNGGN